MYKFSVPMPFEANNIDKLKVINSKIKKSKITSLYFALPITCEFATGFEQDRNFMYEKTKFDYWENLMTKTLNCGFELIYLLNNPFVLDNQFPEFDKKIEKLEILLQKLKSIGCLKIRISAPQLITYIYKNHPEFEIYVSTSLDYKTISEYQNFIMFHPEIKQIVPSHDVNKNFLLLKSLKDSYPNLEIEIMVNEGCMKGCPHRYVHEMVPSEGTKSDKNIYFTPSRYCASFCSYVAEKYPFYSLTLNNNVFPWEIKEYEKLNIVNFKFVGRDIYSQSVDNYIDRYLLYLIGIDNFDIIKNYPINTYIHHLTKINELKNLSIKQVYKYLPNINHFKKYGHLCASRCGVECRYCYKCAEKIQKVFEKNMKEKERHAHYVPACKINT